MRVPPGEELGSTSSAPTSAPPDIDFQDHGTAGSREEDWSGSDDEEELDLMMDGFDDAAADPELQRIQARQAEDLAEAQGRLSIAQRHGFGVHRRLAHDPRSAAAVLRDAPRLICHFTDDTAMLCARIDLHLERTAPRYPGTRFVWIPARDPSAEALAPGFGLRPAAWGLVAMRDGAVVASAEARDQFSRTDMLDSDALDEWLSLSGALWSDLPSLEYLAAASRGMSMDPAEGLGLPEEEEEDYYDCGRDGCKKAFFHEHDPQFLM